LHGRAPYDEVLTHGFAVDAQGRKMSKSLGNVVAPQKVVDSLGADILRLWVASTDYRNEMSVSEEILKRVSDAYRRIRNTARFLLGNLDAFDPAKDLLPVDQCLLLDEWAVQQAYDVQQAVVAAYQRYDFPDIVQRIQNFCTNEMGSLYLDITKDRLYTMQPGSHGRRSAQSAMYRILEALVRWLAPILSFTAEEIWPLVPGRDAPMPRAQDAQERHPGARGESVMFETWYDGLEALQGSGEQRGYWADLLQLRRDVAAQLENMRNKKEIGASLDAEIFLPLSDDKLARYRDVASELRFFFITSECGLLPVSEADAVAREKTGHTPALVASSSTDDAATQVIPVPSAQPKCIRCWHHRPDVGSIEGHPEICGRCVTNLPGGAGENRRYF